MKRQVGLWIDHKKAIIVTIMGANDEIRQVKSNIGKYVHFSGGSYASPMYGICDITEKGRQDRAFRGLFATFYEDVMALLRHADAIWIFGPGEAKDELQQHLQYNHLNTNIVGIDNTGKMTDRQVAAKVRQYYQSGEKKGSFPDEL